MANLNSFTSLPADLPVPLDDGAAAHLPGATMPSVELPATVGSSVNPAELHGLTVLYCYPMTGRPGVTLPAGWDEIPGARGCTPESCGFRDHHADLQTLGAEVYGLSTQNPEYQLEVATRLHLPFALLSDADFAFTDSLCLPTFEVEGTRMVKRLTLIIRDAIVEHVFYPVFPPDKHAEEVLAWLARV